MARAVMDHPEIIKGLAATFPNRWAQATANPKLRGWFVTKVKRNATMAERAAIRAEVDRQMDAR